MSMSYTAFKKTYPSGYSVGKPFAPYDYVGECVSYVLTYMMAVDGIPLSAPIGHAAQIPYNATFKKYYEPVSAKNRKAGDLMFWGDDAGNWTGPAGHTAIYDSGNTMYNQNYNGSRVISRNTIFTPGFIGYFRKRKSSNPTTGGNTVATTGTTKADLDAIYKYGPLGRARGGGEGEDVYLGKPAAFVLADHYKSKAATDKRNAAAKQVRDLSTQVESLKKQLANTTAPPASEQFIKITDLYIRKP